jgi:site-specific DNA recombinase
MGAETFGYTYHRRTDETFPSYTVNQKEAAVVREIYERYAKGDAGYLQIANYLKNKNAYRRPGTRSWNQPHVYHILNNEMYTGVRYFDTMTENRENDDPMHKSKVRKTVYRDRKEWIGIKIPAIISKDLFDTAQRRIEHNRSCYRNAKRPQLLGGLLFCGRCGSRCYSYRQCYRIKRSRGTVRIYEKFLYICNGKNHGKQCDTMQIDTRPLDVCVFEMMEKSVLEPTALKASMPSLRRDDTTRKQRIEKQVRELNQKIKDIKNKKGRIVDLYAAGDVDRGAYLKRITTYDMEAATLTAKRDELTKRTPAIHKPEIIDAAIQKYCDEVKKRFVALNDFDAKRRFLMDFISQITYRNDRVTVHGSAPVGKSSIDFEIKLKIDRAEMRERVLREDRAIGLRGSPIRRDAFGHLKNGKAEILTPISL